MFFHIFICTLHRIWIYYELTKWPAPKWLDSSVGRALYWYRRGHGFESRLGLNCVFFLMPHYQPLFGERSPSLPPKRSLFSGNHADPRERRKSSLYLSPQSEYNIFHIIICKIVIITTLNTTFKLIQSPAVSIRFKDLLGLSRLIL